MSDGPTQSIIARKKARRFNSAAPRFHFEAVQRPIAEMRVDQLLRAPRVPPHWNSGGVR